MALPTNNSRPAIPYVPQQVLPNYDRYESLGQFPPTAQQLDGDLNKMIDLINTLSDEINNVVVGALPGADDPLNANSLMTTDGAGKISWVKASSANLDEGAVTTPKIANAAITSEKIQPQAIDTDQLATNAVRTIKILDENVTTGKLANSSVTTPKIADGAVTNLQMAPNSTKIDKLRSSGHSCFVIGDDADYNYKELLAPADYSIPTCIANTTKPSMQPFSVFWNAQPNTSLSGVKIANTSLTGVQLQNQTITAAQIANQTITATQLQNAGQMVPFAMGYVYGDGSIQKSFNIASVTRTGTGYYPVRFTQAAPDSKYILVFGVAGVNNYYMQAEEAQNSRTTNGFDVRMGSGTTDMDGEFNFVVYAF